MRITVTHDDGTEFDITESVRCAYDSTVNSLDWGSGFLDAEEVGLIAGLAVACRFSDFEAAVRSVWNQRQVEARTAALVEARAATSDPSRWPKYDRTLKPTEHELAQITGEVLKAAAGK